MKDIKSMTKKELEEELLAMGEKSENQWERHGGNR